MKLFLALITTSLLAACGTNIDYKILSDESRRDIKRTVEVELPGMSSDKDLQEVAEDIYKGGYERTFITYVLKENPSQAWATTHFNPYLEITYIGQSLADHDALSEQQLQIEGTAIGQWWVEYAYSYKAAIFREGCDIRCSCFAMDSIPVVVPDFGNDAGTVINATGGIEKVIFQPLKSGCITGISEAIGCCPFKQGGHKQVELPGIDLINFCTC